MAIYQGIEHIAIFSSDTARLRDWYARMLDMKCILDNGAGVYFMLMADGSLIELAPGQDPARAGKRPRVKDSGLRHIALTVSQHDFGAAVHRLVEGGVEIVGDSPRQFPEGMATFHFRDPDGNILHLIARPRRLSLGIPPRLADAPRDTLIQGIEHTCIMARSPETLRRWYIDALGFQLIVSDDGHGTAFVLGADGRSIIEFIQAEQEVGADTRSALGIRHIAIRIALADLATGAARLKALGVEVLEDVRSLADGAQIFFFRDPEGNIVHLVGRSQPLAQ